MTQQHWTVHQTVRDDAENVFVPARELPGTEIGDVVEFKPEETVTRTGHVRALVEDATRGRFVTVELDPPSP
jgi:hypothetical protein